MSRPRTPGAPREVACPACGKPALFDPANRWRPFCSERCRTTDLGGWAEERYRIPSRDDDPDHGTGGSQA